MGNTARRSDTSSFLCPVMVGRDEPLAELQQAWGQAGRMVLVTGEGCLGP